MKTSNIIDFVKKNFSNNRESLIPLLQTFDWEKSSLNNIYSRFSKDLERPISSRVGMSKEKVERIKEGKIDIEELGDISDFYTIVLNPEIKYVSDWDFEDLIKEDKEVHHCRIWISWFLPFYYIETNYEKGCNNGKFIQYGPLKNLSEFESRKLQEVKNILSSNGYSPCRLDYLTQIFPGLKTDLVDEDVTIFDCIFSYFNKYWDTHIRKNNGVINDPYEDNVTIGIVEHLDDNFELINRYRTFYYNALGRVEIVTDKSKDITEVRLRGYIDGIVGNEKTIKMGKKINTSDNIV